MLSRILGAYPDKSVQLILRTFLANRCYRLLKTFWAVVNGWRDQQWPDGTVIWTSPTGQTYFTRPGSRLLFPALCLPTGEFPSAPMLFANLAAVRS
jgi:hypothetical protein